MAIDYLDLLNGDRIYKDRAEWWGVNQWWIENDVSAYWGA